MWEYALGTTGLNLKLKEDARPFSLFLPLDESMLACQNADECGQVDTYWRGQLTTATYFGLLLLHWSVGAFEPGLNDVLSSNDSYVAEALLTTVLGDASPTKNWKLEARMEDGQVASVSVIDKEGTAVTLPSRVVASYATCDGTTVHVIQQPMVPSGIPSVNATSVPGLENYCWKNIWSAGFQVPGQVTVNNLNGPYFQYFAFQSFMTGRFPKLYLNRDLAQPTTNVTFLVPDADILSQILAAFEEIPSEEYMRAQILTAHYFLDGGYCMESFKEPRWIPTLAASYLGQNLSLLVTPGTESNKVEFRTSLQPEKIVSAKFLASGCYGTIFALDGIFSLWERWQDIPPSEPVHFARVNQDLLFGVNPTCRAGDAVVERAAGFGRSAEGGAAAGGSSLSAPLIAGLALGSLAAVLFLATGLVWAIRRIRSRQMLEKVGPVRAAPRALKGKDSSDTSSTGDTSRQACISLPDPQQRVFSYTDFNNGIMQPSDFTFDAAHDTRERVMLGSGRFGQVFAGRLLNGEPVAIKCVRGSSPGAPLQLVSEGCLAEEARILKHCRSAYVVSFVGMAVDHTAGELYLLTQRMVGGDLHGAIRKRRVAWKDGGWRIALDIARGLVYLASKRIVHNDLKSSNVLLDGEGRAKISDVGLAKMLPGSKSYPGVITAGGGSFHWCAPETILGLPCTPQADIFSLGVVMWELATGESPIRGGMRLLRSPDECPPNIANLVESCWERKPDDRPTATQVVESILKEHGSDQYALGA
ncbi:hypothetical protein ACKKBF_B36655 [Auxenochlorella protothecoides x Auxenochlorella symbiontica]